MNPKDTIGSRKAPLSVLPWPVLYQVAGAMNEGARKYGRHNYRAVGVRYSVYFDAFMRHVAAAWEGETLDKESGEPHLVKAMACLMVLQDAINRGMVDDDRPPKSDDGWISEANLKAQELVEKIPLCIPAYREIK